MSYCLAIPNVHIFYSILSPQNLQVKSERRNRTLGEGGIAEGYGFDGGFSGNDQRWLVSGTL